ncbi:MAG TPA: PKD domain-containing protein, partial [Bacteroidia bacterium]|nr:PKD domain-containing protein [Bacteroidia bacterium]
TKHTGRSVSISNPNAYQTGVWTLAIYNSAKNCREEHKFNIQVGSCCVSSPDFTFIPNTNPVQFTYTGSGITNHISTLWSFGDGRISNVDNPIHSFDVSTPTVFNVCLTTLFEDGQGESCCNRICKPVQVSPNANACTANANFEYAAMPSYGNTFNFFDWSTGSGTICNYYWDFGDGTTLNTTSPTTQHYFTTRGSWNVCLTVTNCVYDAGGSVISTCTSQKCMTIQPILPTPKPGTDVNPQDPQVQPLEATAIEPDNNVLIVYPNPNTGSFALSLGKRTGTYAVVVRDMQGREVYKQEHEFNNSAVKINLSNISAGIYTVEVKNDQGKFVQQISITR